MSLAALIKLSQTQLDYNDPAVQARFAKARQNMRAFDEELEARVRARIPTQEQMQKVVNWGTLYG